MAKVITKSIRLPDNEMMRKFVSCQSSFSNAIRYLIIKYLRETGYNNIADLGKAYDNLIYEVPPVNESGFKNLPQSQSSPKAPLQKATSYSEPMAKEPMMTAPVSEIPACYQ